MLDQEAILFDSKPPPEPEPASKPLPEKLESLEEAEKRAILQALKGMKTRKDAAELLGIALSTLYDKMKHYNLKS